MRETEDAEEKMEVDEQQIQRYSNTESISASNTLLLSLGTLNWRERIILSIIHFTKRKLKIGIVKEKLII